VPLATVSGRPLADPKLADEIEPSAVVTGWSATPR
jgi:hypothetical protein